MGLAGVDCKYQKEQIDKVIERIGLKNCQAVNDGFLGIKAASPNGTGACSINGTGTVSVCINEKNEWKQVGGIGYVAGDEGGGSYLARTVVRVVFDSIYRFGPETSIKQDVFEMYNIKEESDFPIALINIIKNGKMGVALSYDILNNTVLSFRSGGKYSYGILGVGYNGKVKDGSKVVAEAGYGIHIPVTDWFEINNEFKATSMRFSNDKTCSNASYLLAPSFTFLNHFNVFGGASFNYLYSNYVNPDELLPNNCLWEKDNSDNKQRMFIGYQIGLQYVF
jgi:hypothetical protein